MTELSHKKARSGTWLTVIDYAKKYGIKNPEALYVKMLKGQVKWREVEVIVKRKQIFDP